MDARTGSLWVSSDVLRGDVPFSGMFSNVASDFLVVSSRFVDNPYLVCTLSVQP